MSHALILSDPNQAAIIRSRCRADLQWHPIDQVGSPDLIRNSRRGRWVVQDPWSGKYVQLGSEEKFLLQQLDGRQTIESLQQAFRLHFSPKSIKPQEIFQLLAFARQQGFLIEAHPWNAYQLRMAQAWTRRMEHVLATPTKWLFSRWSLGNPEKILDQLEPIAPWLFHAASVRFWMSIFTAMFLCLLIRWRDVLAAMPTWEQLLSPQSFFGLGITFVLLKLIHELGHGLACRYFGARCTNAGIFFMMGMMCPYVDVTDSCRLPRRRDRIMVTLAGMYVEWMVASLAAVIWFVTQPGWLHSCCWQVTLVASISTFLFNANPLLRYDGYFALSEWLAVANLKERANRFLRCVASRLLFASSENQPHVPNKERIAFGAYAVLSGSYRTCLLAIMSVGLWKIAARYELTWFGFVAILSLFATAYLIPIARAVSWSVREVQQGRLQPARTLFSWVALVTLMISITVLPLPQRTQFRGQLFPVHETTVYAQTDGTWTALSGELLFERAPVRGGAEEPKSEPLNARHVRFGETIASIQNLGIELAVLQNQARVENYASQLQIAKRLAFSRPLASEEIPRLESALAGANNRLRHSEHQRQRMTVKADQDGVFLPASIPPMKTRDSELRSASRRQTWGSQESLGAKVETGTVLGWIRHGDRWLVRAQISEPDLPKVVVGQKAKVHLRQLPGHILTGQVARVAFQPIRDPLHESQRTTESPTNETVAERTSSTYFIEISIDSIPKDCTLIRGGDADVVLHSRARSIYQLVTLWLKQNWRS